MGNLFLVLLRSPVVILVLFPFCEYAGSSPHDNICADLTWYEASAEKKSHRKIAHEQSQLAEIKLGQKLKKCGEAAAPGHGRRSVHRRSPPRVDSELDGACLGNVEDLSSSTFLKNVLEQP